MSEATCDIVNSTSFGSLNGVHSGTHEGPDRVVRKYASVKGSSFNVDLSSILPIVHSRYAELILSTTVNATSADSTSKWGASVDLLSGNSAMNVSTKVATKTRYYGVPESTTVYLIMGKFINGSFIANSDLILKRNTDIQTVRSSVVFQERLSGTAFGLSTVWFVASVGNLYRQKV